MSSVRGHLRDGKLEHDEPPPAEWPEGAEVETRLTTAEEVGLREEDWPMTPEAIAEWVAWAESLEPFLKTPEEEAAFQNVLDEQRAWELANWEARNKKIEGLFP